MSVFLVVGLVGLALILVSLVIGDLFDGLFDGALAALDGDVFSSAVIGAFVSAFGFGGAIAAGLGVPWPGAAAIGFADGVLVAWFAAWLTRLVRDGGSDATPGADDALGRDATVVTAIPADGFGVVRVVIGGHVVTYNARAAALVEPGTEVHVTSVLSPTAVEVTPTWTDLDPALDPELPAP